MCKALKVSPSAYGKNRNHRQMVPACSHALRGELRPFYTAARPFSAAFFSHCGKLEFVGRADSQVVTSVVCNRSHPDPLGIVLWYANCEFVEGSAGSEQHCHSEPVRTTFVGISIEFQAAHRHPFVGAVIDRPRKRTEFQQKFPSNGNFSPKEIRIWKLPLPGAQ